MRTHFKKATLVIISFVVLIPLVRSQNLSKKYGNDSVTCVTNISLYREVFRQNNYKEAYKPWKAVLDSCPMSTKNVFVNGPTILDYLIKEEKDSLQREAYIQELFDLFELRVKCYPTDEAYVLGRIGVYMVKYRPTQYKEALDYMEKAIELGKAETSPQVLDLYFQTAEVYMRREKLETEVMIDAYDKVTEVLDAMLNDAEINQEKVMREIYNLRDDLDSGKISLEDYQATYQTKEKDSVKAANELTQLRNVNNNMNIRFSKYADCDILMQIYTKKFEANRQDTRVLLQIIKFFPKAKTKCTDNDLFFSAVEELYKQSPNANIAYYMGNAKYQKGEYKEALTYLEQAFTMYEKESDKIKTHFLMADCYRQMGQYSLARETVYKILKLSPNDGRVYIFVGNLYMGAASSCEGNVPGAAYWAAADKFAKAKAVDPTVAEDAQKQLNIAVQHFPPTEAYFNHGLSKGQSYKIECWIGETTTIR
ncbi:MAG: tetratricopeptide repeat protein [Bacteroidales bacterium]|jgi:tetratricopeptide (TPR) repeat protein|nr:tetratricopeptide repeat protein [Bacteroidales bacterium]